MGTTLDEAMALVVEIEDWAGLLEYLKRKYSFWRPTNENVRVEFYHRDDRIDWDTHLVTIDGKAAVFANGPIPNPSTEQGQNSNG